MTSDNPHSEFKGFYSFARDRLTKGGTLVCPVMILWRHYLRYCELWGYEPMRAARFMLFLEREGVELKTKETRGRLKTVAVGVGFNGREDDNHARDARLRDDGSASRRGDRTDRGGAVRAG